MYKLIIPLLFISTSLYADYRPNHHIPSISVDGNNTSLSIATAQHNFDYATTKWQASIGIGNYDGSNALSVGFGKKSCQDCVLFNGSIGESEGKTGVGMGINWRF